MAAPGSNHYGYFFISYEFVYVGNRHGRNIHAKTSIENVHKCFTFCDCSEKLFGDVRVIFIPGRPRDIRNVGHVDCGFAQGTSTCESFLLDYDNFNRYIYL